MLTKSAFIGKVLTVVRPVVIAAAADGRKRGCSDLVRRAQHLSLRTAIDAKLRQAAAQEFLHAGAAHPHGRSILLIRRAVKMDDLAVSDVNAVVVIPAAPHTHLRTGRQLTEIPVLRQVCQPFTPEHGAAPR